MINCPQILVQIGDACRSKRIFKHSYTALLDTGSTINLIREDSIPLHARILPSDISFLGVSGNRTKSLGKCKVLIRPINPFTKNPICEIKKPIICQITSRLPTPLLLGTPFLRDSIIDMNRNLIIMNLGRRTANVRFVSSTCLLTQDLQIANEINDAIHKAMTTVGKTDTYNLADIKTNPQLNSDQKSQITLMLETAQSCFMTQPDEVSFFKHGNHEPLRLKLASEVYTQPKAYSIPTKLHSEFDKQLKTWINQDIVERQTNICEYRTNIVPVKKKDGTYRFTLDCRFINAIIQDENIAIPPVITLIRRASGHKFFTCLDLSSFFLIYKLDEKSSDMLTFVSPSDGQLYKMKRTPFGLKSVMTNAIMLFERELDQLKDRDEWMISYVDDLCIFHNDFEKHITDLKRLFDILTKINVKCKPSKTTIGFTKTILFGYEIDQNGYRIDPNRKESILKIPKPNNRRQLIRVLGQVSYYRTLLSPQKPMGYFTAKFRALVSEKQKFIWTQEYDQVWQEFREAIRETIDLRKIMDSDEDIIVRSDSSQTHYGGTLSAIRNNEEVLIFTTSKAWTPTASRYHISRLELIAALNVLNEFKMDLIGRNVTLFVDNASVYFILTHPERIAVEGTLIPRLFYEIRHVKFTPKKTDNKDERWALVDALSRTTGTITIPSRNIKELLQIEEELEPEDCTLLTHTQPSLIKLPEFNIMSPLFSLRQFNQLKEQLENNKEFRESRIVPADFKNKLVRAAHEMGHLGPIRMAALFTNAGIFWKNRNNDIKDCVMRCETCGIFKPNPIAIGTRQADITVKEAKHTLAVDISTVGQPAVCNFMVAVDLFTSYITAVRVPGQLSSMNIAKTLLNILARYAPNCRVIRFDNATYFKSEIFKQFLESLAIKPWYVTRLNSRGNGKAERAIRSINEQLRFLRLKSFTSQDWDLALELSTLAINIKPLYGGISPYTLNYGTLEPENTAEFPKIRNVNLNKYSAVLADRIKALRNIISLYYNNPTQQTQTKLLEINTLVRLKVNQTRDYNKITAPKFSPQLFKIIDVQSHNKTYKIQNLQDEKDIRFTHHRHVKPVLMPDKLKSIEKAQDIVQPENFIELRNRKVSRRIEK